MNKKGAEMTIGTIVIIVLALIVLVVIALGFTTGWRNLWDKVNVFSGGDSITTVGQACTIACEAGDSNGWCYIKRTYTENKIKIANTCNMLADTGKIAKCGNPDLAAIIADPSRCAGSS